LARRPGPGGRGFLSAISAVLSRCGYSCFSDCARRSRGVNTEKRWGTRLRFPSSSSLNDPLRAGPACPSGRPARRRLHRGNGGLFLLLPDSAKGVELSPVPRLGDGMARLGDPSIGANDRSSARAQWAGSILTAAWAGQFILVAILGGPYRNGVADQITPIVERYAPGGAIYAFTSHTWSDSPSSMKRMCNGRPDSRPSGSCQAR
jgi:hypothetical protein